VRIPERDIITEKSLNADESALSRDITLDADQDIFYVSVPRDSVPDDEKDVVCQIVVYISIDNGEFYPIAGATFTGEPSKRDFINPKTAGLGVVLPKGRNRKTRVELKSRKAFSFNAVDEKVITKEERIKLGV